MIQNVWSSDVLTQKCVVPLSLVNQRKNRLKGEPGCQLSGEDNRSSGPGPTPLSILSSEGGSLWCYSLDSLAGPLGP